MPTHDVTNQPPPLEGLDLYAADPALVRLTELEGGGIHADALHAYGSEMGRAETYRLGDLANRHDPELATHDRFGHRIDRVDCHPAWHALLQTAVAHRVHSFPWVTDQGGFVARAAMMAMMAGVEAGHGCPISMTAAVVPALRHAPEVAAT